MSVDIRYFKYPLSQTFIKSNFFFVPISTPGNSCYKFGRTSNVAIPNFYSVPWALFRAGFHLLSRNFHHSHSNVERINSESLIKCLSFHFSSRHVSSESLTPSLGKKYRALKDLECSLSNKEDAVPKNTISTWTKSKAMSLL